MIEFYQLEQLVTIAKEGTLSKAAEVLLISQPALTRSIQRLEDDLNIKLFDRKKNQISPLKFHHLPRGVIGCY